jgi:hypothetical protein
MPSKTLSKSQRKKLARKKAEQVRKEKAREEERAICESEMANARKRIAMCEETEKKGAVALLCRHNQQPPDEVGAAQIEKDILELEELRKGQEVQLADLEAKLKALST